VVGLLLVVRDVFGRVDGTKDLNLISDVLGSSLGVSMILRTKIERPTLPE
jgi:hypothetical protein